MSKPAPDPVTPEYLRAMIEGAGMTQGAAARLLHIAPRTVRAWLAAERAIPWAMAECLRSYLARTPPKLG
jgi:plasmid maintenance system antidote protein VapI